MEGQLRADEDFMAEDVWCPDEVARAVWGLNRLKAEPDRAFMAACLRHCFSRARQLSPTAICRLLWSIGNVRGWAPPRAWVARALSATHARIGGFSGLELSLLATSLARLEHRPPDAWLATFTVAALAKLGDCNAEVRAAWAVLPVHLRGGKPPLAATQFPCGFLCSLLCTRSCVQLQS